MITALVLTAAYRLVRNIMTERRERQCELDRMNYLRGLMRQRRLAGN